MSNTSTRWRHLRPNAAHSLPIGVALLIAAIAAIVLGACAPNLPADDPLDDEAMQRFKREERARTDGQRRSPTDAAREWFYPKHVQNYFRGMDGIVVDPNKRVYQLLRADGLAAPPAMAIEDPVLDSDYSEVLGRNAWMIWCGGNEGFWDWLSNQFGFIDLLKLVDTRNRARRFSDAGLINEPGMTEANGTTEDEFGLYLDQPADPRIREWRREYVRNAFNASNGGIAPAQQSGGLYTTQSVSATRRYDPNSAYDLNIPPPEIYGLSSGVVGLRLFPNPKFDAKARRKWDAKKYYADPTGDPEMVRPYRVGMSCAFCHASYHPLKPPLDLKNPAWENISGNIGAQYLRPRAVFANLLPKSNFVYHILDSQPPGTIDTSLIASDNINNPNAMNSVFNLPQRAVVSFLNPREKQAPPSRSLPSLWRDPDPAQPPAVPGRPDAPSGPLLEQLANLKPEWDGTGALLLGELHGSNGDPRRVPRILFDGADSIGAWGALARVYLNIGTNYEQWITLHNTVIGMRPQKSFTIAGVKDHSIYWYATELRVAALRDYFLRISPPMPLLAARGGVGRAYESTKPDPIMGTPSESDRRRRVDVDKLERGRKVFARNCIVCHSSVQTPERHLEMQKYADLGEFWDHDPGHWLSDPKYIAWAEKAVETAEFWRNNYLSTDYRIPVNLVQTNSCRAMATNAITGNVWADFASESYRNMPSVGPIPFFNPYMGKAGGDDRFLPAHASRGGAPKRGGGPGFYRVPTLVSIWTTAPLLHNNSLGKFTNDPSIDGRLEAFDDAIRKLLWPERRLLSSSYNEATPERLRADHGLIWRTTEDTYLELPAAYVPRVLGSQSVGIAMLRARLSVLTSIPAKFRPIPSGLLLLFAFVVLVFASRVWLRAVAYAAIVGALVVGLLIYLLSGDLLNLRIGPIPAGTPVNLLANVNPDASPDALHKVFGEVRDTFAEIESTHPDRDETTALLHDRIAPALLSISKCPDFVMDRGHYFEWFKSMSDDDKDALIELLKTF